MSRDGYLPPGCTQQKCDEAQPGYWDEDEDQDEGENAEGVADDRSIASSDRRREGQAATALPFAARTRKGEGVRPMTETVAKFNIILEGTGGELDRREVSSLDDINDALRDLTHDALILPGDVIRVVDASDAS